MHIVVQLQLATREKKKMLVGGKEGSRKLVQEIGARKIGKYKRKRSKAEAIRGVQGGSTDPTRAGSGPTRFNSFFFEKILQFFFSRHFNKY